MAKPLLCVLIEVITIFTGRRIQGAGPILVEEEEVIVIIEFHLKA